jgi:cytochrome c-type biogenesis protein CcmE
MKKSHIIILVFIAIIFGVILSMVGDYSSYESFDVAKENVGEEFHIAGKYIKEKGMEYNPGQNADVFSFYMVDREGNESKVICNTEKPQDFEMADELVVVGKMQDDAFYATNMMTKCPSKYTDEEIAIKKENPGN